ncbi:c-type cytochrome [Ponticoccus alexandrii]|uniref:C-type cytochrome n=1 Tax=Ponticoccus alexandrii TaxID=1943633 RepID=A0ABX7F8F0_9RHOB|nr:cytochrome c [Ponticoccus alexandrii]QRF65844.1 c-type cytochrome [Ponticoccus alexandrii]
MKQAIMAGAALAVSGCGWFSQRETVPVSGYEARSETVTLRAVAPLEIRPGPLVETWDPVPGAALYAEFCTACHGATGRGDGPLGGPLPVAPADLTGLAARNGGHYPGRRILDTVHGTPGPYHRGTLPGFDRLLSGEVREWAAPDGDRILAPKGLIDLVAYVGTLQVQ